MTTDPAEYSFVPWVREGYRPTGDGTPGEVAVELAVDATGESDLDEPETVETTLSLYGPGEVTGVDRRQVVRTDPSSGTGDFPPNYFPYVEFDRPDLPWLFSPGSDDDAGRLDPWLCLITVERGDGVSLSTDADGPASVLEIGGAADPGTELPDLSESWAWAHAQTVGADDATAELDTDRSPKTLSRLLSPRDLDPKTDYYACLVPAFEAGKRAGLDEDPSEDGDRTFDPAWDAASPPDSIRLPVYFHWGFSTGDAGDFESLVRRLGPETLTDVGIRTVDVGDPGPDSLRQDGETVSVEGALRSTDLSPDTYDPALRAKLEAVVDAASALESGSDTQDGDPVLGPPTYGQWPPAAPEVPAEGSRPAWLRDLNVDPRYRVAAAFGTDVVQDQQEHLMRNAWEQVGDVRRANQLLRRARLAREASRSLHVALDDADDTETLLRTEPLHGRTTDGTETIGNRVAESALPSATLSPAFRRITRANGPLARRFGGLSTVAMVDGVADGSIDPGDDRSAPDGTQTVGDELAAKLCSAARESGGDLDAWHPLGEESRRGPRKRLSDLRDACRELRERTAELRDAFEGTRVEREIGQFIEPLMGVCAGPGQQEFESDLDRLLAALEAGDERRFHEVLTRVFDRVDESEAGHETLRELAASYGDLREALDEGFGVTPAYESFRSLLRLLTLSVFREVFWVVCSTARRHLATIEKHYPERSDLIAEIEAVCVAICGPGDEPGNLLERVLKRLESGETRALRSAAADLDQTLAMAADRIDRLLATLDDLPRDSPVHELAAACEAAARYATALRERLAAAPWSPAADAVGQSVCPRPEPAEPDPLDVSVVADAVVDAVDPADTIAARLGDRLGGVDLASRSDGLDQILAHPEFKQPMYEALADRSKESLLPGVGEIPGNSVGVLETNPAFIESYMLGLSHEMARELRWREYPTDMRGTFFRQFWDPAGRPETADGPSTDEAKRDIDYVHRWNDSLGLGGNYAAKMAAKTGGSSDVGGQLVLIVRGEVLDRYPNTHVYAAKGRSEANGDDGSPDRVPDLPEPSATPGEGTDGDVKHPLFRGTLDPDITFFGFDLTEDEAVADPGWFFVVEEPPSEPTFGLDVAVDDPEASGPWGWEDLTWDDVAADGYVSATTPPSGDDVPGTLPSPPMWGKKAAHVAEITWQRPFRIAIHADDMISQHGGSR
ncbi:hypothetical protein [Halosimplex salinum]|uniref:hypothetical protein n=1 Tax=Halosimplex salinum TaxID=1710538 RepID=UPI000F496E92|nr:hypothetical protein [Halosimplex salinum]